MPNENGELTAAEKHEQARAFALSGKKSKFQIAKEKKKALARAQGKQQPVKAGKTMAKASKKEADPNDPKMWPSVDRGDWQYVYIAAGTFQGRFGYYDDHDEEALVYFGAPLLGDGPYEMPLSYLRKPPASYCENVYTIF
jgi:hypothetical protein